MLIVALVHDGRTFWFYEDAPRTIEEGDLLILIESSRLPQADSV
jgi:voltage-gated potassium channel